jgi:glucuronokinase
MQCVAAQVAESVGAAAKLTGSGGAVVVLCPEGPAQERRLAEACAKEGLICIKAEVGPVNVVAS